MERHARLLAVAALLAASGLLAHADEWTAPRPVAAPKGEAVTVPRDVASADHLPSARVFVRQRLEWPEEKHLVEITFDAVATPSPPTEKGHPTFGLALDLGRVAQDDYDAGPRARAEGKKVSVLCELDEKGYVARGQPKGADGEIASVGVFARPAGSWVLPYVPKTPIRVGDTWDLPLGYFLWSINQPGAAPPKGFATQVVEAIEDRHGTRCVRIRTVASIERPQPKGMTPPTSRIGEGDALARFRGEGVMWVGVVDGCLREETLDVRMRLENLATKKWMEWSMHRETLGKPAGAAAWPKDWTRMTGGRPVPVGYEAAVKEGTLVGQALMCVVVKYGDPDSEGLAFQTFHNAEAQKAWQGYLPAVIDLEDVGNVPNKEFFVAGLPGLLFLDLDGSVVFMLVGASPKEIFETAIGAAANRVPKHEPSPEYKALLVQRDALRTALAAKDSTRAAVTALLAIKKAGLGVELLEEDRQAEIQLTLAGQRRIDDAVLLALGGKAKEAKAALAAVASDYAGLPVAARAQTTSLPAPPTTKPK